MIPTSSPAWQRIDVSLHVEASNHRHLGHVKHGLARIGRGGARRGKEAGYYSFLKISQRALVGKPCVQSDRLPRLTLAGICHSPHARTGFARPSRSCCARYCQRDAPDPTVQKKVSGMFSPARLNHIEDVIEGVELHLWCILLFGSNIVRAGLGLHERFLFQRGL